MEIFPKPPSVVSPVSHQVYDSDHDQVGINVINPPAPYIGVIGDGTSDDSTRFQNIVNSVPDGSTLVIPVLLFFAYPVTITNKSLRLMGIGYGSGFTGTAGTLIQVTGDYTHTFQMDTLKITTTGSNNGVSIQKTWTAGAAPQYQLNQVWFDASGNGGTLLSIYGARESGVSDCWFSARLSWTLGQGTAIGIALNGDTSGGAMNISFAGCKFVNIFRGVYGQGDSTRPDLFAGFSFNHCTFIACNTGIEMKNGGEITVADSLLDYQINAIILRYWGGAFIHDNYLAVKDESDYVIQVVPQYGTSTEILIHDNGIYTYGTYTDVGMTAKGVVLDGTLGGGSVQRNQITNNIFRNFSQGVYIQGSAGNPSIENIVEQNTFNKCQVSVWLDTYAQNNRITKNMLDTVTTPFHDGGTQNQTRDNQVGSQLGVNAGAFSVASTAGTYTYQFPHGLYASPKMAVVNPATTQTRDAGAYSVSWDATNVYVNFAAATAAGLSLKWSWYAEV